MFLMSGVVGAGGGILTHTHTCIYTRGTSRVFLCMLMFTCVRILLCLFIILVFIYLITRITNKQIRRGKDACAGER